MREKYNLIQELQKKNEELKGKNKYALVGQGDFTGGNNVMRGTMNIKHHTQHLTINDPEFCMLYDGKENLVGEHSSFYYKTDKPYRLINVVKKYDQLLNGKSNIALYFLYCKDDNSYTVVQRQEVENLTESFGFTYKNNYIDNCEIGETIPKDTVLYSSTSYDDYGNVSVGVNGRILYAVHPGVQDDAIIISESFAKRMVADNVTSKTIPLNEHSILLNLYGKDGEYQGLPNIGDTINSGFFAATRTVKESRMFSDMRDSSLRTINPQGDQVFYCEENSEVVDINIYCNNPNLKSNKVNKQILQYYNDAKWFYTEVYKTCRDIIKSGSDKIDKEINRWMRKSMNYLDTQAVWAFNDNIFSNLMIEILLRKKEPTKVGRKIVGRHGNKTVVCTIWPDNEMPYLTTERKTDKYGAVHPHGIRERVDLLTNPLAIINRTIPMVMIEGSVTFIIDKTRKHMATLETMEEKKDFLFDIFNILNPKQCAELRDLYPTLTDREKREFINDAVSINPDGTLNTANGIYLRWEAFETEYKLRDAIIQVYEKYPDIYKPYNIFIPKPKWGRDIWIGEDYVGYQYIMMLKQSGEHGFSVRSSGAISDESLPEKSNENKQGKKAFSEKPIRFGEYESPWLLNGAYFFNCGNVLICLYYQTNIVIC